MDHFIWKNKNRLRVFIKNKNHLKAALLLILGMLLIQSCNLRARNSNPATDIASQEPTQLVNTGIIPEYTQIHTASPTLEPSATTTVIPSPVPTETPTPAPTDTSTPQEPVVFAVIGDYGSGKDREADVAELVMSWNPEFIITLGDNNYPDGSAATIDENIGQFYHSYIYPYAGSYGEGADENRFFPTLGNHDVMTEDGKPYYDYFTLPGNERYYDNVWGPVHIYSINILDSEPDGVGASSAQAEWLKSALAGSTSAWDIVYMHYSPYSSGTHGSLDWAQWPFAEWGAEVVMSGHDHTYERLNIGGMTYFVNGLGGGDIYDFGTILEGSQVRYNSDWGAMRMEASDTYLLIQFITRNNEVVDTYKMER